MDEYNVFLSEPAEHDLDEISFYISTQLLASTTAENMIDAFYEAMSSLKIMPKRHPFVEDIFLANLGYRMVPVKNYLIFYSADDLSGVKEVNIERVLYAGRDWQHVLNPFRR